MENGCNTPQGEGDSITKFTAYFVDNTSHPKHTQSISQLKGCYNIRVVYFRPSKFLFQRRFQQTDHLSVKIIDRSCKKHKRTDRPAVIGHLFHNPLILVLNAMGNYICAYTPKYFFALK